MQVTPRATSVATVIIFILMIAAIHDGAAGDWSVHSADKAGDVKKCDTARRRQLVPMRQREESERENESHTWHMAHGP